MKSNCISTTWICFPAAPFQIGFSYPFPAFTQSLFTFTGLCYSQGMPMLWPPATLATLTDTPATRERLAAFWALDSTIRTYHPKVKDSEEATSASYTMSSAAKSSSKYDTRFGMADIEGIISPRSIKRELATG
ncbi:hypothetical protein Hanom_Chr16g01444571 [Helianthus anomalus]